jgi:3-phosphoglycerate kinase
MSTGRQLLQLSEEMLAAAVRDQPDGMLEVLADARLIPQVLANVERAMQIRYDRAQRHPLHPAIRDIYGAVHRVQAATTRTAEQIAPAIERLHQAELDRLRHPRPGEGMWDVRANRGGA